ncbi:MAG: MFS transporter, partial [Bacilli bacterium]|nr:MFS transporter [Bacilli bacterium]
LGYIVGVFGGGFLIGALSEKWTFFLGGLLMLLASFLFFFLRFEKQDTEFSTSQDKRMSLRRTFASLRKNGGFWVFLLALGLSEAMYLATDTAFSLYTVDLGIEDHLFGFAFGAAIVVEFFVMLLFRKQFGRKKMKWALILGASAQLLRPILFAIPFPHPYAYLFFDFLRGLTVGFFLAAMIPFLRELVGEELLYPAFFFFCLFRYTITGAMNFAIPLLAEAAGYMPAFLILAGGSLIGLILLLPIRLKEKEAL